jgi:hypothetical protein
MKLAASEIALGAEARIAKKLALKRRLQRGRWGRKAALAVAAVCATAFGGATTAARAGDSPACPSSTHEPYSMQLKALTGSGGADLTVTVAATSGCALPEVLKKIQLKTFAADGSLAKTSNITDVEAPGGIATDIDLGDVPRDRQIEADVLVQAGTPERTYVLRGTTKTLLRPDLVVEEITPQQTLVGKPVVIRAVIGERNGDVGATAVVSMSAIPGATEAVVVPPGGHVTVNFAAVTFAAAVPVELTVKVDGAAPAETDTANNERTATLDVTEHQLPTPRTVLFPSLVGYGAQFNNHLYAPITPWPAGQGYGNVEEKVKKLEPQLVRIFYNDNWDGNADGRHPEWQTNYASLVDVVKLAQETGATIDISFQNLGSARLPANYAPSMAKFADVLEDLVRNHGLTNVRWAEVGNEPNSPGGLVTLDDYNALYRALHAQLVARDLREQIQLMGGGLVENANSATRNHYEWMKWIAANMGDILDAYAEHVYWIYNDSGRLEYRLRDSAHLLNDVLPAEQRKPTYMMEFGIRGFNTCGTKPPLPLQNVVYYRDESCTDIWRTNIAGFQQLWFNIDSAQLGVAGTAKWDAFWGSYDLSSPNNQLYWMIGPPTEGSPVTPTYNAMSLLFHTTVPGWQIVGVEPWEENDRAVPTYGIEGHSSSDQPEKELVAYSGPQGELTVVGLDTHGKNLNTASPDQPSEYSIGGLPANTAFNLALWNATGDGTNSIAGTVTANAAGVVRFTVPLQAAFALTTVPVS